MKALGIEHIAIAVKNMEKSKELFSKLLGIAPYKEEIVESEGVKTVFFLVGNVKIELLEALNENSPVAKFLEKKGEGLHHIALAVENAEKYLEHLKNEGFQVLNEKPKEGADNKMIAFLHPKSVNRVLVEICSDKTE